MKEKSKRNVNLLFILLIFISIIFMSIGYSALNIELTISGEAEVSIVGDIRISNITTLLTEGDAYTSYNPTFSDASSNIGVTLPNENSKITMIIEVTNNTNEYYHLENIIESSNNANINYEILNKEIIYFHPNSVTPIEVIFSYETFDSLNQNLTLNLQYNYKKVTYKNLEYLVFSGFEYIETGLSNTGDYIFETEFNQVAYTADDGGWIISGRTTAAYTLGVFNGKSGVFNGYGGTTSAKRPYISLNTWYTLYFSRTKHTIGDYNYSVNGRVLIPAEYEAFIRIGGATEAYAGGYDPRHFNGYIKNVKITDATTGEVIRHYVPAEIVEGSNTGELGYWDIINDVFYGNAGTGAFLAP